MEFRIGIGCYTNPAQLFFHRRFYHYFLVVFYDLKDWHSLIEVEVLAV
jgi:hypothetical protein